MASRKFERTSVNWRQSETPRPEGTSTSDGTDAEGPGRWGSSYWGRQRGGGRGIPPDARRGRGSYLGVSEQNQRLGSDRTRHGSTPNGEDGASKGPSEDQPPLVRRVIGDWTKKSMAAAQGESMPALLPAKEDNDEEARAGERPLFRGGRGRWIAGSSRGSGRREVSVSNNLPSGIGSVSFLSHFSAAADGSITDPSKSEPIGGAQKRAMGFFSLKELAQKEAKDIIMAVVNERSGFPQLIQDPSLRGSADKMILVLKILSVAFDIQGSEATVTKAMNITVQSMFFDALTSFNLSTLPVIAEDELNEILRQEAFIFYQIVLVCPTSHALALDAAFKAAKMAMDQVVREGKTVDDSVLEAMDRVGDCLQEVQKADRERDRRSRSTRWRGKRALDDDHLFDAPDDFRSLLVVPSAEELRAAETPFIRTNLTKGEYGSPDHYLDVQFRLLKEDFVRPLREGIKEVLGFVNEDGALMSRRKRFKDIRIYQEGVVVDVECERNGPILTLQFSVKELGRVRWNATKRLIFGSLLCLTHDGFKSVMFASVVDRNVVDLGKGIIRIRPESQRGDLGAWTGKQFLIVESQAYFESYRHFLTAMQRMKLDEYPLAKYIVKADTKIALPAYLVKEDDEGGAEISLKHMTRAPDGDADVVANLLEGTWPSAESLGLDEAQFQAFKAGLTRECSIIQGPPGTGKTFLGLKLVETILKLQGENEKKLGPIFVVCYTNHALDQFLEGISAFTEKILRVGGRSQNEAMERFTVRSIQTHLDDYRATRDAVQNQRDLSFQLKEVESVVLQFRKARDYVSSGTGILRVGIIRTLDAEIEFPSNFNVTAWLGIFWDPSRFVRPVIDYERRHVTEKLAGLHYRRIDGEDEFNEDEGGDNDADVDDEVNFAKDLRDVEAFYGDEDRGEHQQRGWDPKLLAELFETNTRQLQQDVDAAERDLTVLNRRIMACSQSQFAGDEVRMNDYYRRHNQVFRKSAEASHVLSGLREAKQLLQIPTTFDLDKPAVQLPPNGNLWAMNCRDRWLLYRFWANAFSRRCDARVREEMVRYEDVSLRCEEARSAVLLEYTKGMDVVGMTTTGAAKNVMLVQNMGAKVVVVEEAAEVLESHIVCCLSKSCQHLILIGDHQQLKPSTTVYQLAKEYNLDISLFERLLNNGVPYVRLRTQHRMRPEIASLLRPHIYEDLEDHSSVFEYPDVLGMEKNVFFLNHFHQEETSDDSHGKSNEWEAEMLLAVCQYLLLQGYKKEAITILTGYTAQLLVFKELVQGPYSSCRGVRITLVDNFQGEENKIILLSLVRSNYDGNIGFLRTENRVNVAFSRAKEGLYIVGNMDVMCSDQRSIWPKIKAALETQGSLGFGLRLRCQVHHDEVTVVKQPVDFPLDGGCSKICGEALECGHLCARICHIDDRQHSSPSSECKRPCERKCAEGVHDCAAVCGRKPCPPCQMRVTRTLPACKHEQEMMCSNDVVRVICKTMCEEPLACGHKCAKQCHVDHPWRGAYRDHLCTNRCEELCPLGHQCKGLCSEKPCLPCKEMVLKKLPCEHERSVECHKDPSGVVCTELALKQLPCGHEEEIECHQDVSTVICIRKCSKLLECGHPCPKMCREECGGCDVIVEKTIPGCLHAVKLPCETPPRRSDCVAQCERFLPCGHACDKKCCLDCQEECQTSTQASVPASCGHTVNVPCHLLSWKTTWRPIELVQFCKETCGQKLECGHVCHGTCGCCLDSGVHAACNEPCQKKLICGHECKGRCGQVCPPCKEKCLRKCEHGPCPKACGEPCGLCKKKCKGPCDHIKCNRRCSDGCQPRPKCNKPCRKKPPCGHECVGMCGEVCPPCRQYNPNQVEFYADDKADGVAADDARFVYLPSCKHAIEVTCMDEWMKQETAEIAHRTCPKCDAPVLYSRRYKDEINGRFEDISSVMRTVSGHQQNLVEKNRLIQMLMDFSEPESAGKVLQNAFKSEQYWKLCLDELGHEPYSKLPEGKEDPKNAKRLNALEAENLNNRIALLKALGQVILTLDEKDEGKKSVEAQSLERRMRKVAAIVMKRKQTLTASALQGYSGVVQRFRWSAAMLTLKVKLQIQQAGGEKPFEGQSMLDEAKHILVSIESFTEERELRLRDLLESVAGLRWKHGVGHRLILNCKGLQPGTWFKCNVGHLYCVQGVGEQPLACKECEPAQQMADIPSEVDEEEVQWRKLLSVLDGQSAGLDKGHH